MDRPMIRPIEGYSRYGVTPQGEIINLATGRHMKTSLNNHGTLRVGLIQDGGTHQRHLQVGVVVLNAYADKPEPHFTTPIFHDYDRTNANISNLSWRPRWFATEYHKQGRFYYHPDNRKRQQSDEMGLIECLETGLVVGGFYETAMEYGILERQLLDKILDPDDPKLEAKVEVGINEVFPTGKNFLWVK